MPSNLELSETETSPIRTKINLKNVDTESPTQQPYPAQHKEPPASFLHCVLICNPLQTDLRCRPPEVASAVKVLFAQAHFGLCLEMALHCFYIPPPPEKAPFCFK